MNFVGTGAKLAREDFARAAHMMGCDEAAVRAVVAVEARGSGWDSRNRPVILYEPHVAWRCSSGSNRAELERQGLAYRSWRPGAYPASSDGRYQQLERAMAVDETAALKACSWGLGQVLGENHVAAGFADVRQMVEACLVSEGRQLDCMVAFIISNRLDKALRSLDWAGFARGYNGPGYLKNDYHTKLAREYRKALGGERVDVDPLRDGMLSEGDKGEPVKALQMALRAAGFRIGADGDFGPVTRQAVTEFQERSRLTPDGKVGPKTGAALGLKFWS